MKVMFGGARWPTNPDLMPLRAGEDALIVEVAARGGKGRQALSYNDTRPTVPAQVGDSVSLTFRRVKVLNVQGHQYKTVRGQSVPRPVHVFENTPPPENLVDKVTIREANGRQRTFLYGTHTVWLNEDNFPRSSAIPQTTTYPHNDRFLRIIPLSALPQTLLDKLFQVPQSK